MSEFQPPQEIQVALQKSTLLISLVSHPGWTQVFEPYLRGQVEDFKATILTGDFTDVGELKLNQEKLKFMQYILAWPAQQIAEAAEMEKNQRVKEASQSG